MKDFRKMTKKELKNYIKNHVSLDFMMALACAEYEYRQELEIADINWGRS
jgi:hypothetical protein